MKEEDLEKNKRNEDQKLSEIQLKALSLVLDSDDLTKIDYQNIAVFFY